MSLSKSNPGSSESLAPETNVRGDRETPHRSARTQSAIEAPSLQKLVLSLLRYHSNQFELWVNQDCARNLSHARYTLARVSKQKLPPKK